MNNRTTGAAYEEYAARYLASSGCEILARNFRCRQGEIDIVAVDRTGEKPCLVFVEVKYRKDGKKGHPEEAVTRQKKKTILSVASFYLARYRVSTDVPCRFDVIAFEEGRIRHIRDAFRAEG